MNSRIFSVQRQSPLYRRKYPMAYRQTFSGMALKRWHRTERRLISWASLARDWLKVLAVLTCGVLVGVYSAELM